MRWSNWGVAVAAFYVLFAASTLGFVGFAMSRPVQLVSPDYYERALRHDQQAEAAERARALGARLRVELPSDARADRTIPLALDASGRQRVPAAALARGRWLARIDWVADGRTYFHETGLVLR